MAYGPALALGAIADAIGGGFKGMRETTERMPAYESQIQQNMIRQGMLPGQLELAELQRQTAREGLADLPQQRELRGLQIQAGRQGLEKGSLEMEAARTTRARQLAAQQALMEAGGDPQKLMAVIYQYGDVLAQHPMVDITKANIAHPGRTPSQIEADQARAKLYGAQADWYKRRPATTAADASAANQQQRSIDAMMRTANDMVKKQISGPMGMVDMTRLGATPIEQVNNYNWLVQKYTYDLAQQRGIKGVQPPGPTPPALVPLLEGGSGAGSYVPQSLKDFGGWLSRWWSGTPQAPVPTMPSPAPPVQVSPQGQYEGWQMTPVPEED